MSAVLITGSAGAGKSPIATALARRGLACIAGALRRLLDRAETVTLVVIHDLALRYIAAAAATSSSPSNGTAFPNAVPYLFDEPAPGALRPAWLR